MAIQLSNASYSSKFSKCEDEFQCIDYIFLSLRMIHVSIGIVDIRFTRGQIQPFLNTSKSSKSSKLEENMQTREAVKGLQNFQPCKKEYKKENTE